MKRFLAVLILCATPAYAGPKKVLTALPRLAGRTAVNMATFRNKTLAFQQWAIVGAVFADGATSHRVLTGCLNCRERSPLMPYRPSGGRYWLEMGPLAFGEVSFVQAAWEQTKDDPNWFWRNSELIDTGIFAGVHLGNAIHNMQVQRPLDGGISTN